MIVKYTYDNFEKDVKNLIRRIKYSSIKFNTIVAIARGGLLLGVKLSHKLKVPLLIISARSYNGYKQENLVFNASFTRPLESPALIVDDITDTGNTLQAVTNYISSMGIDCKTATLCYKEKSVIKPTWYCRKVDNKDWIKFFWE